MILKNITLERAVQLLSVIKEFKKFSLTDLEAIAKTCQWHNYSKNEQIVRYHDDSNSAFFITEGSVRVNYFSKNGKEVILCNLPTGEIFGELTAIDGLPRSASVMAKENTLLASISSVAFLELIYTNRQFANTFLQRLTCHIRRLTDRVIEADTLNVPNRVRAQLLHLAKMQGAISENEAIISPAPTHIELACLIGTNREAVTRELGELKAGGIICCAKHGIQILDVAKLSDMVESDA
ncbi:MAG: Crp/Fnr family transcriptional regulator [Nitrosomonas sp.]